MGKPCPSKTRKREWGALYMTLGGATRTVNNKRAKPICVQEVESCDVFSLETTAGLYMWSIGQPQPCTRSEISAVPHHDAPASVTNLQTKFENTYQPVCMDTKGTNSLFHAETCVFTASVSRV